MRGRALALGGCIVAAFLALLAGLASAAQPQPPPVLKVEPSLLSFGSVCIGKASTKSFTITNDGSSGAEPLVVTSISRSGWDAFNPKSVGEQSEIAQGTSRLFDVTFAPATRTGPSPTTYRFRSQDGGDETRQVTGTGRERKLSASRTTLSFGEQRVSTRSPSQTLSLTNTGGDSVTVAPSKLAGGNPGDFRVTLPGSTFTVGPGASTNLSVAFQPTSAGLRNATLELTYSNQWCSAVKIVVALGGTGIVPDVIVEPNPVQATASPMGKESKPVEVTLTNNGKAPLKITAIQVVGTDAADFSLKGLPVMPVTVPPSGKLTFQITMTPSSEGLRSASINVLSDDPDAPAFTVPVRGTAGAASPSPTARPTASRTASPSPSQSVRQTSGASPQALAQPANDNLAVGMVVAGVVIVFGGLLFIRRLVAHDED